MSTAIDIATTAYDLWRGQDTDGVAALFGDKGLLAIPGRTRISGDHRGTDVVKSILAQIASARASGKHRQEIVCSYNSDTGAMFVFDNFVTLDSKAEQYHSVHEWIVRDGKLVALMIYLHEYDVFERAWG